MRAGGGGPVAAFAAALFEEANAFDSDAFFDGFAHVVDSEGGDAGCGERFHLDSGGACGANLGGDAKGGFVGGFEFERGGGDGERMAEGDEVVGALGGHDPGDSGDGDDVAFGDAALEDAADGVGLHVHEGFGEGDAFGGFFGGNIDHAGGAALVEVGEFTVHGASAT